MEGEDAVMRMMSLLLAAALVLVGCGAPGRSAPSQGTSREDGPSSGEKEPARMNYALAEPVYPEFPKEPELPETEKEWEAYREAYDKYMDAMMAIRGEQPGLPEAERAALAAFAARSTPLALAGHEGENAVYSPLSLWSALAMLARCANGDSRQQVLGALETDSVDGLQEAVSQVWRALYTDDGKSSLILANSIWLNGNLRGNYVQETLDVLAQKHFAGAYSVPMGTDEADRAVTGWVKEQTNGLIGGDSPVVETKPETLALLASSLYYKAAWLDESAGRLTEQDIFTDAAGQESKVDFMHRTERAAFLRQDGYQAASLNTHLGEMVFVLPDEGVSPESLLQSPDLLATLDFSTENSRYGEVQWSVPKFDVNSDLDLKSALSALGVSDLLDPEKADLSALTDLDAFLSDAKQLARVKVDEEGVEAAAVTIMMVDATSAMPDPDPEICVMDLDRPFLFVIRTQGVPLFVGIVNQV